MKISKAKLRQVIKEEISKTRVVPRAARMAARRKATTVPTQREAPITSRQSTTDSEKTRPYGGKVLGPQEPGAGISINDFSEEIINEILDRYAKKEDVTIGAVLGRGAYGIVYEVEGPSGLSEALKITVESKEYNAYREIENLKDKIEATDENVATALPTIYDTTQIVSIPVERVEGPIMNTFVPGVDATGKVKKDAETYRFYLIRMEMLQPLPKDIRSDIFGGPDPWEPASTEARQRFIDDYLSLDNLTNALESLLGEEDWERLLSYTRAAPSGRGGALWRDMDKYLGRLKKAYLDSERFRGDDESGAQHYVMQDLNEKMSDRLVLALARYIDDKEFLENIRMYLHGFLWRQMAANMKLPQYDPEYIKIEPGLASRIIPPASLQGKVAKNFYSRLQKLEKYDVQYGDVHAHNLMMREDGDLVVADVGLFLFGPKGFRTVASSMVERLAQLAGIIRR